MPTLSFLRGVTAVKFRDYALGCVGMIPGTVAFVFIGTTASGLLGDMEDEEEESEDGGNSAVQLIVLIVGGVATVIAVVLISIYAKRALNKVLEEDAEAESNAAQIVDGSEMDAADDIEAAAGTRPSAIEHSARASVVHATD